MATGGIPVRMDDNVHYAAKIAAAREGITLVRLLTEAVVEWLNSRGHPTEITRPTREAGL